jgi:hypothetical protein
MTILMIEGDFKGDGAILTTQKKTTHLQLTRFKGWRFKVETINLAQEIESLEPVGEEKRKAMAGTAGGVLCCLGFLPDIARLPVFDALHDCPETGVRFGAGIGWHGVLLLKG